MRTKNTEDAQVEQLDTVATIWVLASNDENPEISYRGIRYRLRLANDVDERQLVARRGELFRLNIPPSRLDDLKNRYREGKHLPSWLRALSESERQAVIEGLTVEDFFRSQFRAETGAPKSPIEVLDWGLKHIDRLRSALVEKKESRLKQWSAKWIPLASTGLAVVAIFTTTYMQVHASTEERTLKEYELAFRPKVDGYTRLMQGLSTSFQTATRPGDPRLDSAFNEVELAEIQLEPFLKPQARAKVKDEVQEFIAFCLDINRRDALGPPASDKQKVDTFVDTFLAQRDRLQGTLFTSLFQ